MILIYFRIPNLFKGLNGHDMPLPALRNINSDNSDKQQYSTPPQRTTAEYKSSNRPQPIKETNNDEFDLDTKKKSIINKLMFKVQRLSNALHRLNRKKTGKDDMSSMDFYNFYKFEIPPLRKGRAHQVNILINCKYYKEISDNKKTFPIILTNY